MTQPMLTIKQAAEATGRSKPTILRAIKDGKISATKDENGLWRIDPAELERSFPRSAFEAHRQTQDEAGALRLELAIMQQRLDEVRHERERERLDKDRHIASLSGQLEAANDERRTTLRQLTALLTDQRAKPATAPDVIAMPPPSTSTSPATPEPIIAPAPAAREDAAPRSSAAVKVRPMRKPPAPKEAGWFRRMMGGR
jgi:excisionase family DNA binding protein